MCVSPSLDPSIVLVALRPGDAVADPVHIVGRGTAFEGVIQLRIRAQSRRVIAQGTALGSANGIPKDFPWPCRPLYSPRAEPGSRRRMSGV